MLYLSFIFQNVKSKLLFLFQNDRFIPNRSFSIFENNHSENDRSVFSSYKLSQLSFISFKTDSFQKRQNYRFVFRLFSTLTKRNKRFSMKSKLLILTSSLKSNPLCATLYLLSHYPVITVKEYLEIH